MKRMPNELIKKLRAAEVKLALAESITCGLAANKLSSCVGVSDVLTSSIVCYTPESKMQVLGVKQKTIEQYTCESPQVTQEMAEHLCQLIDADMYAAVTGLASSDGSETREKPVGTVFYCIVYKGKAHSLKKVFNGAPLEIKKKACIALYEFVIQLVEA